MTTETDAENICRAVADMAETIAGFLPEKTAYFVAVAIDADKIEAWVERLREIAGGAPDQTLLNKSYQDYVNLLNEYNELVKEYNERID